MHDIRYNIDNTEYKNVFTQTSFETRTQNFYLTIKVFLYDYTEDIFS